MALKRRLVAGIKYGLMWTSPDIKGIRGLPAFTTVVSISIKDNGTTSERQDQAWSQVHSRAN
jgi:hypothetical protein